MNSMVQPGTSYNGRIVSVFGPGTADKLVMRFHAIYAKSTRAAGFSSLIKVERFRDLMDRGAIVVFVIIEADAAECCFGIELRRDDQGDYLNFMFIYGFAQKNIPLIVDTCFQTWNHHRALLQLKQEGRLLIMGRRGWERVLRWAQLEYVKERDGKYWVYEYERGKVQ